MELSYEDVEGRILKQQEENHRLRNLNQERFKNSQNNNNLLGNKLVQIQKEASRLYEKKFKLRKKKQIQIRSPSQFRRKSIQQKNKQQEVLIDTQITKSILTNDRVKMNINRAVMIAKEKNTK